MLTLCPFLLACFALIVCVCVRAQGPRDTPSARAAQLGPQTLVNLFNSPLYSDVIFMVQGGFRLICTLTYAGLQMHRHTAEEGHFFISRD